MIACTVRIAGISRESVTDGPGLRTTIFFQGCPHACPGCHNPQTRDFAAGKAYTPAELIAGLPIGPLLSGFTFSGGEPFSQAQAAAEIGRYVRARNKNLWVYSGYTWEQLLAGDSQPGWAELLALADVLVDGPFLLGQRDLSLPFRGSANQRLIRPAESLRQGRPVLWQPADGFFPARLSPGYGS